MRSGASMSDKLESNTKEEAYLDRNLLAVAFLKLAEWRGIRIGRGVAKDGWVPLYAQLPSGQVSWHVPVAMVPPEFWNNLSMVTWDGHDLKSKQDRMRSFVEMDTV